MVNSKKASKKGDATVDTIKEVEDSAEVNNEEVENSNQENGVEDSSAKKKAVKGKPKEKKEKPQVEPARKSSRTPKPVTKEGDSEAAYEKFKSENRGSDKKAKKRPSKSPVKSSTAKKTKKVEKDYEVEQIVGLRIKNGKKEFKIRWKGYKESDDSWEPEKHLSCQDLIDEYLKEHGDEVQAEEKKTPVKKPVKKSKTAAKSGKAKKSKKK